MLQLKNIRKVYETGDTEVEALKEIDLSFRKSEFVSILGPSGCGKTTLLNIIGGLDRYTSGDLIIDGVSTKEYKDADWDIYRNNSIGFVFQSYNLIPHQTVLSNVELALTLAGVSREERKKRAVEALEKVGLSDQLNKKPNQMSGGQMQRVAIARALVNNPEILLADEPTGALDSETSVQIMELLKEIAKDRLIIMVTHNADLAEKYSTRIVRLLDGSILSDDNPYMIDEQKSQLKKKKKKVSMSFMTALSLSLKNLLTKKTRTLLTAFAGSIGIIGIALILSLSSGMQSYISSMEEDTLSNYPIEIQSQSVDIASMMGSMMEANNKSGVDHKLDKIYSNNITTNMVNTMSEQLSNNDLKQFKSHVEDSKKFKELTNSIKFGYDVQPQIFQSDTDEKILQVNPSDIYEKLGFNSAMGSTGESNNMSAGVSMPGSETWEELIDNPKLLESQYDVLKGTWPKKFNEVVLVIDQNNEVSDSVLYSLGLMDSSELEETVKEIKEGKENIETKSEVSSFSYDEILQTHFKLVSNTDYYVAEDGRWLDKKEDIDYMKDLIGKGTDINIVGIIRQKEEVTSTSISGSIGYLPELTNFVIENNRKSEIAQAQLADKETNVFTGKSFDKETYTQGLTIEDVKQYVATLPMKEQEQAQTMMQMMPEEEVVAMMSEQLANNFDETATYDTNISTLGIIDLENPSSIKLYPKDFESKEELQNLIKKYNDKQKKAGHDEYVINYTDIVGVMIASMTSVIDIISYVLIAFVAISLVVSSIMIGIITYISVLERTKEIGILRSIGASKKDISRVFNAETVIEGFAAGIIGILMTLALNIPINMVIKSLVGVSNISVLPVYGGVGLIIISIILTVVAGFIPAKVAAKKDPVEALRTE
ncbi:ABC transporter ATP-binding protein/permease [Vagococcus elongatus]|uniref:ABC transporter n=1 Tax=Vagococcus elongatus TaxID=180344 RepID=A0A430B1T8_9ENTE|nr:ABC transporter ATP-binding protein/permease [Vagococcus elongatus]RSU14294.1 ABC transporter [Vagococcus elongatus]